MCSEKFLFNNIKIGQPLIDFSENEAPLIHNRIFKSKKERDNIRNFQPPITGQEIMTTFKVKPSKVIGTLKEIIKEAILEGDIPNEYNAAYELMINEAKKLGLKK